jgi:hypothetical protein
MGGCLFTGLFLGTAVFLHRPDVSQFYQSTRARLAGGGGAGSWSRAGSRDIGMGCPPWHGVSIGCPQTHGVSQRHARATQVDLSPHPLPGSPLTPPLIPLYTLPLRTIYSGAPRCPGVPRGAGLGGSTRLWRCNAARGSCPRRAYAARLDGRAR